MSGTKREGEPIAVVGLSCLFPEADSLAEYWELIREGRDTIREIPATHWSPDDYYDQDPQTADHTYATRGGFLRPYRFQPLKYGITPQAIEATDTTQLLGMVVAEEALKNAGYGPDRDFDRDRTSCILGVTGTLELVIPLGARLGHPHWRRALARTGLPQAEQEQVLADIAASYVGWQEQSFPGLLGNVVAGRIANRLDLGGTNTVVDAACASSLGALSQAVMELQTGRADMVLTGGMDTFNGIFMYMCFAKTPALSPTGDVRPYDAGGDGTILGEGLGAIVLKRLSDAERDGDRIYAQIRGLGSSSDGRGKAIYAPSAKGQIKALKRAYADAGCEPSSVQLIEGHGTGTRVGDGVELDALSEVFADVDPGATRPYIGSVKSQIGHTKAAAGVAGVIKAVMALYHKVLPPSLKIAKPHPKLEQSPFQLTERAQPWLSAGGQPRRAGVSAFGFGGSNFHCVLEEYETTKTVTDWPDDELVLPFAGGSRSDLENQLQDLAQRLATDESAASWQRLKAFGRELLAASRDDQPHRLALHCRRRELTQLGELIADTKRLLRERSDARWSHPGGAYYGSGDKPGELAFVFSGQGSQSCDMLRPLALQFPEMLAALERGNRLWAEHNPQANCRLSDLIYPPSVFDEALRREQEQALKETAVAQPAIGAVSAGLVSLLQRFGLSPAMVAGHSFGELTALFAAGALTLDDFLQVACLRGQTMQNLDANAGLGSMVAIRAPLAQVEELLARQQLDVVIANHNAPEQVVVAGSRSAIGRTQQTLKAEAISSTELNVGAAFHSPIVAPAVEPFHQALTNISLMPAQLPVFANETAAPYPQSAAAIRQRLATQIAQPVRFVDMIRAMYDAGARAFVEVGPQSRLSGLIRSILADRADTVQVIGLDEVRGSSASGLNRSLAQLFAAGFDIDVKPWQEALGPEPAATETGFHVEICGANYRQAQAPKPQRSESVRPAQPILRSEEEGPSMQEKTRNDRSVASAPANPTIQMLEKHLLALQQMQSKNAELHQQFLDGQAESQRMIRDLLDDYRQLTGWSTPTRSTDQPPVAAPGGEANPAPGGANDNHLDQVFAAQRPAATPSPAAPPAETVPPSVRQSAQASPGMIRQGGVAAPATDQSGAAPVSAAKGMSPDSLQPDVAAADKVQGQVLAIIADKTGYPVSMLTPDMDLESDLGIDSIKRVEILSGLQESYPQLNRYSAEQLNDCLTIASLIDLLQSAAGDAASGGGVAAPAPASAAAAVANSPAPGGEPAALPSNDAVPAASGQPDDVLTAVQSVISEKTGYPAEMLSADQDLESDLGVDSIKRVEIFAELQGRLGLTETVNSEAIADLRTIADITQMFTGESKAAPAPEPGPEARDQVAPAAAAVAPEPPAGQPAATANAGDAVMAAIARVISDKTGYPVDMLEPTMELEQDLGIDSIKRVEILSALGEDYPQIAQADQEQLTELLTIADLERFVAGPTQAAAAATPSVTATTQAAGSGAQPVAAPEPMSAADDAAEPVTETSHGGERSVVGASGKAEPGASASAMVQLNASRVGWQEQTELAGEPWVYPEGARIWVTDDGSNLARNIVLKLREKGLKPRLVSLSFVDRMRSPDELDGLILLAPLKIEGVPSRFLTNAFKMVKMVAPALRKQPAQPGFLVTVTRNGGLFGFNGLESSDQAIGSALSGMVKTLRHEWQDAPALAVDLAKDFADGFEAANRFLGALRHGIGPEIGVFRDRYVLPQLSEVQPGDPQPMDLGRDDTVLITGGARGVTYAIARRLATESGCRLILWGRTSLEGPEEPEWLQSLSEETAIIQALGEQLGPKVSPRQLRDEARTIMNLRHIRHHIEQLEALGSEVLYQSVDVRKDQQMVQALGEIEQRFGPLSGLVHGAGVLADKPFGDLDDEDFAAVVETKIKLLPHLSKPVMQELKFCALFSSSTARFGRQGQLAYAVANEGLNKYAQFLAHQRPSCRILAFNWGPWAGGMVDASLAALFQQEGLALIPLEQGSDLFWQELNQPRPTSAELVVLAKPQMADIQPADGPESLRIDLVNWPFLADHVLNGQLVVPVVMHLELMARQASHIFPDMACHGVRDFKILKGIVLPSTEYRQVRVRLDQQQTVDSGVLAAMLIEVYDTSGECWRPSSQASIWLSETRLSPVQPEIDLAAGQTPPAIDQIYAEYLFHGPKFQGLSEVTSLSPQGAVAHAKRSPEPKNWGDSLIFDSWCFDPLLLDSGFQLGVVWSSRFKAMRSLPVKIVSYIQYCAEFPAAGCWLRLLIQEVRDQELTAAMEFVDEQGQVLARMKGYHAVMDESLGEAFRQRRLPDGAADIQQS
jgi:acyl transferase domain-containing protein/NAD(P)-dependent dehydrogenase (short-subunit alcohol dehydrogenase family)